MIRTPEFSIAPSATAALLARRWLGRRWLFFLVPVMAALVSALSDWRWFVVALMMLFIIWPMALFFVWCNHALDPDAVRASQPHTVGFGTSGITLAYTPREEYPTIQPEIVPWHDIRHIEHTGRMEVFVCLGGRRIMVPAAVLDAAQWREIDSMWRTC